MIFLIIQLFKRFPRTVNDFCNYLTFLKVSVSVDKRRKAISRDPVGARALKKTFINKPTPAGFQPGFFSLVEMGSEYTLEYTQTGSLQP